MYFQTNTGSVAKFYINQHLTKFKRPKSWIIKAITKDSNIGIWTNDANNLVGMQG